MKKFLMYLIIVVVALFIGFTTYYAVQNKETIVSTIENGSTITLNIGDTYELPIEHTKPYKDTTIDEDMKFSDQSIVSYNKETKTFLAEKAGLTTVTITPSNKNYGPFTYDIRVCDGSEENPLLIKTAKELKEISQTTQTYYQLGCDIDLATLDNGVWSPLQSFKGGLNGNGFKIKNLKIDSNVASVGLFEKLEVTARVENIVFENASVKSSGTITGLVAGTSEGFIGKIQVFNSSIESTSVEGYVGGIVGLLDYSKSQMARVQMCETFFLSIVSKSNTGGIAGKSNGGVILDCLASSVFSGEGNFAGIVNEVTSFKDGTAEDIAIVKYSTAIINGANANVNSKIYGVIKTNTQTSAQSNAYINNYYFSENQIEAPTGLTLTNDNIKALTENEVTSQESYKNYNFDNVWYIEDGDAYAHILMDGYYSKVNVFSLSNTITTAQEFKSAVELIKTEGANAEYVVANDIVVDYNNETWIMIEEFSGRITSVDGAMVTIKNFKIDSKNNNSSVAMFNNLTGTIENITIENVTVLDMANAGSNPKDYGAAVVAVSNKGIIKNVHIKGLDINFKGSNIGGLVVDNKQDAQIISCSVNKNYVDELINIKSSVREAVIGGLASQNNGLIKNTYVGTVLLTSTASTSSPSFGGLVGLNNSIISECEVVGAEISYNANGGSYAGGIANSMSKGARIEKSYANTVISLSVADSNSKAGGLVNYVSNGATIATSASEGIITAYNAAGLVNESYGLVEESYTNSGKLTGVVVSGLVNYACDGSVTKNCYTLSTLEGYNDSSVASGFVYDLRKGAHVEHCFSAVSFTGIGSKFAESATEFRTPIAEHFWEYPRKWVNSLLEIINKRKESGTMTHCAITGYGDAAIQYKSVVLKTTDEGFLSVSADEFTQKTYQKKFTDHGFDINIWDKISGIVFVEGDPTADCYYPTLKNAYKIVIE